MVNRKLNLCNILQQVSEIFHSALCVANILHRSNDRSLASYQFHNTVQDDNNKFISFSIINQPVRYSSTANSIQ
ncbi:hypothetical protein T11_14526 [Trichinella zimbabwensis]|uniref:Uncharacterized protein n=1 Tax=Trichinella zimbabwensis TaxID=268475 RepID=A0A0V1H3N9_9BILA|nr:hypothetical protein T11_14526 [Trichinella zimbabwensis]